MKHIFSILFLFGLVNGFGQDATAAKKLLDEVSSNIASYDNLFFEFSYVLENQQENIKQETNGSVTVKGDKYKLNYLEAEQLFDGQKTYTIVPDNEEVTISSADDEEGYGINPSKLLSFYKDGYRYEWDIKQKVIDRTVQFIKLVPTMPNETTQYLLLGIDLSKKSIYRLIDIGKNSTRITLTITNQKENIPLNNDFFVFNADAYPDYYINN